MSSIMDRLKKVEGTTSFSGTHSGDGEDLGPTSPTLDGERAVRKPARAALICRVLAGGLAALAILFLFKMWRSESPPGKDLVRSSRGPAMVSSNTAYEGPPPGALDETGKVAAAADGKARISEAVEAVPLTAPRVEESPSTHREAERPQGMATAGSERGQATDSAADRVIAEDMEEASSAQATAGLPTRDEDERAKSFLLGLKVTGVYKDTEGYLVFIDGREFKKGDAIGRIQIAEISSDRIAFAFKGKRYNLRLR